MVEAVVGAVPVGAETVAFGAFAIRIILLEGDMIESINRWRCMTLQNYEW